MLSVLPDAVVTTLGTAVTIHVLTNDSGSGLTVTSFSNPAHGSVIFSSDQSFTYTPAAGFVGSDSFAYTVRDAQGTPSGAEVTITVAPNDGATRATDDYVEMIAGGNVVIPVLSNDLTATGSLQLIAISVPGHGAANVLANQSIRYVPQSGFVGIDSFTYTVIDQAGTTTSATVTVKVLAENRAPLATGDAFTLEAGQTAVLAILGNDSDPDGDPLQVVSYTMPGHGSLVFNADKTFSYTPNAGYEGADQFTYTIRDNRGASASASVLLNVVETAEQPTAADDHVTTEAGVPVTIDVLGNDGLPAGQEIRIVAVTLPFKGKLVFNLDGTITYTPDTGFVGFDDFTYTIGNDRGGTARARVTIEVTPAVEASTYANGYSYRRRIVVPASSARGGSHENFPLWVELSGAWLKSTTNDGKVVSADGRDLRFELEDGTKLAHEIERYDAGAGELGAWVRLPEFAADQPTVVLLHYGKAGLAGSEADPAAVWQDYLAVWHLPGGEDVTSAGRSLAPTGTIADVTDGLGAGALALNGNGVLTIDDTSWLRDLPALSVQMRSKAASTGHDQGQLAAGPAVFSSNDGDLIIRYQSVGYGATQPQNLLHSSITTTAGKLRNSSPADTQSSDWQSIALVWQSGESQSSLYLEGAKVQPSFTETISSGSATTQISGPLYLGASTRDSAAGGWVGLVDEVRFRPSRLADAWIAAEHLNQSAPALFYGIGAEETIETVGDSIVAVPFDLKTTVGKWVEIDVLAAAQIPAGSPAPTIQATSQPANGTISVINEKIRYSPAASFVGEDGFTFTLAAADRTSTARVRVIIEPSVSQEQGGSGSTASYLRTVNVANATQLSTALSNAAAGDDIVLANGTYNSTFTLSADGTATNPIQIRAQNPNNAVIQGRLFVAGRHAIVQHLRWQSFTGGDSIVEVTGRDCRLTRNWFIGCGVSNGAQRGIVRLQPGAHDCEVSYNEFRQFAQRAICVRSISGGALRAVIRRNYLKQNTVVSGFSGVAIGFGGDSEQGSAMRTELLGLVEYNLIEDVGGGMGNILQAKSSRNTFRFNTARNCDSFMEIRSGQFCDLIGNAILNGGGPSVQGVGHRMIGNYNDGGMTGSWRDMGPRGGLLSLKNLGDNQSTSQQTWAEDCLFAGNIGILRMGGGDSSWQPTRNNIVEGHDGAIVNPNVLNTTTRALTVAVPPYQILTAADVGPLATAGEIG